MKTSKSRTRRAAQIDAMPTTALYPLRFEPILKRLIWGGRRLGDLLGKPIGPESDHAECWEVADHAADVSRVSEGPLTGVPLRELVRQRGPELLGDALGPRDQFPLLIKFIDAHQVLSVQVHPDDARGRKLVNDNGKTEAWVVLHADPGSLIYCGLKPGVDRAEFTEALGSGAVEPLLHRFEPKAGDCVLVPAGTVHAIGAGIVLVEVQQMSDATFRVYDWGRLGADGRPRPLHLDHALESIDFERGPVGPVTPRSEPSVGGRREGLCASPYFRLERVEVTEPTLLGRVDRFTVLIGLKGLALIEHEGLGYRLSRGQCLLLPASIGPCTVAAEDDPATVLTCVVPTRVKQS